MVRQSYILPILAAIGITGCTLVEPAQNTALAEETTTTPSVEDARTYIEQAEAKLTAMWDYSARANWIQATNITVDTNWLAAKTRSESTQLAVAVANGTKAFEGVDLPDDLARKMHILRSGITIPAPSSAEAANELAQITTGLNTTYSTGTFTHKGDALNLTEMSQIMAKSRDPEELKTIWEGWRTVSPPMASEYARMVEIANEGTVELGFQDVSEMWLSNYDMPADEMRAEVDRLWGQVQPMYEELHCHVRAGLNEAYGDQVQLDNGPIRADLLGNMWAQQWSNIYPLVAPETSAPTYDLTAALETKNYDALKMVETAEAFFTSIGLQELPDTFWQRSMITRPQDRDVVCHASAWDMSAETENGDDVRIKMCTEVTAEDFQTVHHELGHIYYYLAYGHQDLPYQTGAHDGFHEAIGDFLALSVTPSYLKEIGLIEEEPPAEADLALLMNAALDKIAFLPFAISVDSWRWGVLDGSTPPAEYNESWVNLRLQNQGVLPPGPRPADAFDPGAKFHIPNNTPYLRYFLSFVMQFQFHKAACDMMGWDGPLHRCSIYGNEEVGAAFNAMMEKGASGPWPDALEAFTGTRQMDASAIEEYFDPLLVYLRKQNEGRTCGW